MSRGPFRGTDNSMAARLSYVRPRASALVSHAGLILALGIPWLGCRDDRAGGGAGGAGSTAGDGPASLCLATDARFSWPLTETPPVPTNPSWKSSIEVPRDEFYASSPGAAVAWVKFIVVGGDSPQILFQNSQSQPFHYDFAVQHIPEFQGMTPDEFDAVTLRNEGRRGILGAVVTPTVATAEYGVQIVSSEDLHPDIVSRVMQLVAEHVTGATPLTAFYMPSGASASCATNKLDEFTDKGIVVGSVDRWLTGDACYSQGWAVGRLVELPSVEVERAYLDGRLTPSDILLLEDSAPAELPFVAGILTLAPSTPNAHAAILARSYGIPFAYLRQPSTQWEAKALDNHQVVVSTTGASGSACEIRFIEADGVSAEELATMRQLALPSELAVTPKQSSGTYSLAVEGLTPDRISQVGGKAANFGLLRAAAPDVTPQPAIALTFDLWDAFMDAPLSDGAGTLRQEIASRLAPVNSWPVDVAATEAALEGIRDLIKTVPFPDVLRPSVMAALAAFDPARRIRFRSSTNVEDSEQFTGAGLYDSATGCIADDLDEDVIGPSLCNSAERDEHGVLRAIQRVFASFYFRNAYLERLRRGVSEGDVGMAILVHYSVPDAEELANGVATVDVDTGGASAHFVTQTGATSVSNPDGNAVAEEVSLANFGTQSVLSTSQVSSLVPLGAHVLEYEGDYIQLMSLFAKVADEYAGVTGKAPPFSLDFEYKKVAPGTLSLRQVRPLPRLDSTETVTPFYVGNPSTLCMFPTDAADVFASHRLKARVRLEGRNTLLTEAALSSGLYQNVALEYVDGNAIVELGGQGALPAAEHSAQRDGANATVSDSWRTNGATWVLNTQLIVEKRRDESPILTADDSIFTLAATWNAPVPTFTRSPVTGVFEPMTRTEDRVYLWPRCPEVVEVTDRFPHINAAFSVPGVLTIEASYWYPPMEGSSIGGYTAPIIKWESTTITGATTSPIVLTGYYSQTYAPQHHNFGGAYIFEPRLDAGVSAAALTELAAANITAFVVIDNFTEEDQVWALGGDGRLRRL